MNPFQGYSLMTLDKCVHPGYHPQFRYGKSLSAHIVPFCFPVGPHPPATSPSATALLSLPVY